jgi:small subunit ribosomal protein S6
MLNLYEAMYLVDPALNEQEVEALAERLKSEITARGGEIVDLHHLGKKRLAYSVKKRRDGFYLLIFFRIPPGKISELTAGYSLNEAILRFLFIRRKEGELKLGTEENEGFPEEEE